MQNDFRNLRRQAIFEATYALLAEKGYKGTSMLAVARKAKASNETMYNWFGDKQGLLAAMIEANAAEVADRLSGALDASTINSIDEMTETLEAFGSDLLQLLTGEKSVALNRAAAADVAAGNVLGPLLAENGRNRVVPLLQELFSRACKSGFLGDGDPREMAEVYVTLLVGDVQIRRVIGVMNQPESGKTRIHSERVNELFLQLFGA